MNTFDELDLSSLDLDFLEELQGSDDDGDEDIMLAQSTKDRREHVKKIWYRSVSIHSPTYSYRDATSACISPGPALGLAENVQLNMLTNPAAPRDIWD